MIKYSTYSLLFLAVLFTACKNSENKQETASRKTYPVISIKEKDTVLSIPYVADIQARKNVELHARLEGILEKIYINEGQRVQKGQLLFKINDSELQIELNKAEAAYKSAKADAHVARVEAERVQTLVDKNIITRTELDLAKAKYHALLSKADLALAEKSAVEKRISYTRVTSPFDGIVDRIPLKEGSLLTSGSLLTTISDISSVFAYFNISEDEYFQILHNKDSQALASIDLVLPDGTLYPQKGKLETAESEIDANTGSIAYKAMFNNPEKILRHGASGKLLITKPVYDALLIPQKSVFEIQDKNYVFVVDKNNTVKMKSIQTTQRLSDFYLVTGGISANDRIVYEGIQSLREGEIITPKTISLN